MTKAKIAITVSPLVLKRLDAWVKSERYASRGEATEQAVEAQLRRLERTRPAAQCALLNVDEEQATDTGQAADAATWPAFQEAKFAGPGLTPRADTNRTRPT